MLVVTGYLASALIALHVVFVIRRACRRLEATVGCVMEWFVVVALAAPVNAFVIGCYRDCLSRSFRVPDIAIYVFFF